MWGVLISQCAVTAENGLLTYALSHQAPLPQMASERSHEVRSRAAAMGALRECIPSLLHCRYFGSSTASGAPAVVALPLCGEVTRIGRLSSNDIELSGNPCISGVHCTFSISAGACGGGAGGVNNDNGNDEDDDGCNSAKEANAQTGAVLFTFSDSSTNGCVVNGVVVGKGRSVCPLLPGAVVELMNAGPRRSAEYNLQFVFYDRATFQAHLLEEEAKESQARSHASGPAKVGRGDGAPQPPPPHTIAAAVTLSQKDRERRARRHTLLLHAQWRIAAQVQRMYSHRVTDFYQLDANAPIGKGGFGKVFRAALRSGQPCVPPPPPAAMETVMWTVQEEELARSAYIDHAERMAPGSVVEATRAAAAEAKAHVRRRRQKLEDGSRACGGGEDNNAGSNGDETASTYVFAVKIIQKKRLLLDALAPSSSGSDDDQEKERSSTTADAVSAEAAVSAHRNMGGREVVVNAGGNNDITVTAEDQRVLQSLFVLETQQEDLAERRKQHLTACAIAQLGISPPSVEEYLLQQQQRTHTDKTGPAVTADSGREAGAERQVCRQRLLERLHPALRKHYEKELREKQRHQCEVNVLLAVRHPHITRLFEVFDYPEALALVMELARGGEVFDLLRPAKPPLPLPGHWDAQQVALRNGGPLPEFIVKMIIVQVLEAVFYLHAMGVVHRDLKLENLLLQRPCNVRGLCAQQLEVFLMQLRQYCHDQGVRGDGGGGGDAKTAHDTQRTGCAPRAATETQDVKQDGGERFSNPLSPLHTVHLPRALWPVVKVTDFGLSRILPTTAAGPPSTASPSADAAHDLIYKRHEMTTSCGTPIYAAPEITTPALRPHQAGYSAAVDLFSVGVITYALLTGKAPFKLLRDPKQPGRTCMSYEAPSFERYRQRVEAPPSPGGGGQSVHAQAAPRLPAFALIDHIHVRGCADGAGPVSAAERWRARMAAFSAHVNESEARQREHNPQLGATATPSVFAGALEQTVEAAHKYSSSCAAAQHDVDLDRFVWESLRHTSSQSASPDDSARFALPVVSRLGKHFTQSLLQLRPEYRMTAREALRHPWLSECLTGE